MAGPRKRKASQELGPRGGRARGIGSRSTRPEEGVESAASSSMMPPPQDPPHRTATPSEVASSSHMSPSPSVAEVRGVDSAVKMAWRSVTDARQFFDMAQWSGELERSAFVGEHSRHGEPLQDFLIEVATDTVLKLRARFESIREELDWPKLLPPPGLHDDELRARQDDLIHTFVELRKIDYWLHQRSDNQIFELLRTLIPRQARRKHEQNMNVAVDAFNGEQRGVNGELPSRAVFEEVLHCFKEYNKRTDRYLAPYTSLVGPSGIGKSYTVQQLAKSHNLYVSYATFGTALTYPSRSPVVDEFQLQLEKDVLVGLFEVFILFSLEDVCIIRELGVSPAEFYSRQVDGSSSNTYREHFAAHFRTCWTDLKGTLSGRSLTQISQHDVNTKVHHLLAGRREQLQEFFGSQAAASESSTEQPPETTDSLPYAVICLDEARGLLQHGSNPFRAFRQALRNIWQREEQKQPDRKLFFGLLLDTSSRIGNFSPAAHLDPSQKLLDSGKSLTLFSPIYMIDSWDVFQQSQPETLPTSDAADTLRAKQLFSFGRPLWGAYLNYTTGGEGVDLDDYQRIQHVTRLAYQKLDVVGGDEAQKARWRLAMLSYRVDFYVFQYSWAEDLVSGWMRYITGINTERTVMHTTQPSDPLLAWISLQHMLDFKTRIDIIGEFQEQMKMGTIHLGDVGELVGALLLLFAYDHALVFKRARNKWPKPVLLSRFMRSFFGDKVCEGISQRVGSNIELRDLWEEGEVFFTHVERLSKPADEQVLRQAYRRGAAVFLQQNAPAGDIVIPIYLPRLDKMSYFCVQVKNRKGDSFISSVVNECRYALDRAPSALGFERPHISMMMCLRAKQPEAAESAAEDGDNPRIIEPPQTEGARPETRSLSENESQSLVLMAVGLNASIYPFLQEGDGVDEDVAKLLVERLSSLLDCLTMSPEIKSDRQRRYIDRLRRH